MTDRPFFVLQHPRPAELGGSACLLPALFAAELSHPPRFFEESLIDWCAETFRAPDGVFLDVGAHTGTYALRLRANFRRTVAVEPARRQFYALAGGVALSAAEDRVLCVHCAAGARPGEATLHHVSPDGGGSSLLPPADARRTLAAERVRVDTLDNLLAREGEIARVAFLKIDVEGAELDALRGAAQLLRASGRPPILFECNGGKDSPELRAIDDLLRRELQPPYTHLESIRGYPNMFLASAHP